MPHDSPPEFHYAPEGFQQLPAMTTRNPYHKVAKQSSSSFRYSQEQKRISASSTPSFSPASDFQRQASSPKSVLCVDGRGLALPRTTLLFAALLSNPVEDLLRSADNLEIAEEMLADMCESLNLPPPSEPLRAKYDTPRAHLESRAALVLEEARYTLCQTLYELLVQRRMEPVFCIDMKPINSGQAGETQDSSQLDSVTTFRRTAYTRGWFTPTQMTILMPGQVLHFTDGTTERLGLVSASNRPLTMMKQGMIDIHFFDPCFAPSSCVWTVRPVGTSLINIVRQFEAVTDYERLVPFFDVIRGARLPVDPAGMRRPPSRVPEGPRSTTPCLSPGQLELPRLNESQQRAATLFLESKKGSVTVVQGPPGTGKSSLAVGVIGKYLMSRFHGSRRHRIMICAPTNKAISHIAKRFLDVVRPEHSLCLNVVALGSEEKLDNDSEVRPFPFNMKAIHLFSWVNCTIDEYTRLKFEENELYTCSEKTRRLHMLRNRLRGSLGELPPDLEQALRVIDEFPLRDPVADPDSFDRKIDNLIQIILSLDQSVIRTNLLNSANVIFSTLSAARSAAAMTTEEIDCLIIDEAAAATEPALYIPFHLQPKRMLVVGDPMQLPAVVKSPLAIHFGLAESFHERLMERLYCREFVLLDTQYRMKPGISLFPSRTFYRGRLRNGENVVSPYYGRGAPYLLNGRSFIFLQVLGDVISSPVTRSFSNRREADTILHLLRDLRSRVRGNPWTSEKRLRIITFYHEQVAVIRDVLSGDGDFRNISVETVDSTQGCESDIVILSFVKGSSNVGFLKDDRRLNVALTRARYQLICVGDVESMQYLHEPGASTLRLLSSDSFRRESVVF